MDSDPPEWLQTAPSRNFSRPFPSPLTASSLDNSNKLSRDRDLFNRLPYSASLFNISKQPGKNEYLAANRSMDFTQTTTSTTSRCHRQLKMIPLKREACPDGSAGIVHSSSQVGQEVEAVSRFYGNSLQDGKHHQAEKTVTNFCSRTWRAVPRDTRVLSLDLFRKVRISKTSRLLDAPKANGRQLSDDEDDENEDEEDDSYTSIIPSSALYPLLQFRQLAHLSLTGMVESYQPLIWRVVWLQPFLRSLHLSMALAPVFNVETDQPHQLIDGTWSLDNGYGNDLTISEYLGHHGEGILHEEFGEGEYLDSQAIKMARQQVARRLPFNNERFLPVEKLSLERFVVDGGSIMRWFDPQRLREIEFRDGCVDAGLYLKPEMRRVKITAPAAAARQQEHHHHYFLHRQHVGRTVKMGELKVVDLKKGRVVSRKDTHTGKEELDSAQKQPGLKAKMSQLMHGWTSKRKGD